MRVKNVLSILWERNYSKNELLSEMWTSYRCTDFEKANKDIIEPKKKSGLIVLGIVAVIVMLVVILCLAFREQEKDDSTELKSFSSKTDKQAINQQVYGKDTPEKVVVEAIQAMADSDTERIMHIVQPDMLSFVLQNSSEVSLESDDYKTVLEEFTYYLDHEGVLSSLTEVENENWECNITNKENWSDEEIKMAETKVGEYLEMEISDGVTIYFDILYGDKEQEIKSDSINVVKVNGKWYLG